MFFTPKVESCYAALFDFLNVVESIIKVSSIPLPPDSPPDTVWDYSPPLLLFLLPPILIQQLNKSAVCSTILSLLN